MCGIAGIFSYPLAGPKVRLDALALMGQRMQARGPDGDGVWVSTDQTIALLHRRLAVIDLSPAAAQPMVDDGSGNRIVFNGEIYNFRALRRQLEDKGHRFRSNSDTEVLLKLYAEYGVEFLSMLRGMYALGLWDEAKQGLLLARDPFGIKPLYFADDGRTLQFASQVRALLAGGQIDTRYEPAGHVGFFLWGHVPEPYTLYRGIRALPAGGMLWLERAAKPQQKLHTDLSANIQSVAPTPCDAAQAKEILRDALIDTVAHHLVADVPVGVFLSAGKDSSTLAALGMELQGRPLRSITLGFEEFAGTDDDEVPWAERLAAHYGTQHDTVRMKQQDFEDHWVRLLEAMDQPSIDGVNSYFVSLAAQRAGVKVVLSGLGGDELFAGYSHFNQLPRLVSCLRPVVGLPRLGVFSRRVFSRLLKGRIPPKAAGLLEYGGDYAGAYLLRRALYMPWELSEFMDRAVLEQGLEDLQTHKRLTQTCSDIADPRLKITALDSSWYMRNQLLRDADWASMAHSIEVRTPFVDPVLYRRVIGLVKAGHAPTKQSMIQTVAKPLPVETATRAKTGFSVPMQQWLQGKTLGGGHGYRARARQVYREFS